MIDWYLYTKIIKVIKSCKTKSQTLTARKFSVLALREINKKREWNRVRGTYKDGLNLSSEIKNILEIQKSNLPN